MRRLPARAAHVLVLRTPLCCRLIATTSSLRLESPALDAAERLVNPTPATPATGPPGLAPDDPRVVWREYWSVADEAPYYHNLKTNEVTWFIPEGFLTRFPNFHAANDELVVGTDGRVTRAVEGEEAPSTPSVQKALTLKQKLALYGSGGLLLYLIIHNVCLFTVFVSIYVLEIDLVGFARSYGFNIKKSSDIGDDQKRKPGFLSTFFTAVLLNKMTVPGQLLLTLLLAPRFVPTLQPFANRAIPALKRWFPFLPFKGGKAIKKKTPPAATS